MFGALYFMVCLQSALAWWTKGVVHYTINNKDYDLHSQEIIVGVLSDIQREICLKFFQTPPTYAATVDSKILYITNPDKRKNCPPDTYNYTGNVVDMPIGYKCITTRDVARIVVDMLRASVEHTVAVKKVNSNDLVRKFQEQELEAASNPALVSPKDRNFINAHYHLECGETRYREAGDARRTLDGVHMSTGNEQFYHDLVWPLGIVMYGVDPKLQNTKLHTALKYAMTTIELSSCIVFQEVQEDGVLRARSFLWFGLQGAEVPQLGFIEGNQTISLSSMIEGAPGHSAHTLCLLMRALGLPMQSNRHDRDYYVIVNWNNVIKGKEIYLEKTRPDAWLQDGTAYDFDSVTHAPANYMCRSCAHGETTIQPAQDHLWQRTLSMGHRTELSDGDRQMLHVIYSQPCRHRYATQN